MCDKQLAARLKTGFLFLLIRYLLTCPRFLICLSLCHAYAENFLILLRQFQTCRRLDSAIQFE